LNRNDTVFLDLCRKIDVNPDWLYNLIQFESGWNPLAENRVSSAKGLIQFTDSTARDLGYESSRDLIEKNPDVYSQLLFPVRKYLDRYAPFKTKQQLYMSVFYPAAMSWPEDKQFPEYVQVVNPGIKTPGDYIRKVDNKISGGLIATIGLIVFILLLKNKNGRR
jgi:hypothetical protein